MSPEASALLEDAHIDGSHFLSLTEDDLADFRVDRESRVKFRTILDPLHTYLDHPETLQTVDLFTFRARHRKLVSVGSLALVDPRVSFVLVKWYN